eukprot:scaffold3541_cov117-Isochrysis_galbana.AAC.15
MGQHGCSGGPADRWSGPAAAAGVHGAPARSRSALALPVLAPRVIQPSGLMPFEKEEGWHGASGSAPPPVRRGRLGGLPLPCPEVVTVGARPGAGDRGPALTSPDLPSLW